MNHDRFDAAPMGPRGLRPVARTRDRQMLARVMQRIQPARCAMLIPQVTVRGIPNSRRLEAAVLERVSWLEQFYQGIVSCRVLIEAPDRHRRDGRHFHVTIELTVPHGKPIVISHAPSMHGWLKDAGARTHLKQTETDSVRRYRHAAIHDAFDVARRRLQDFARRQRGAVKRHEIPAGRDQGEA